ncbi:GNAT family N-acetyltransferase [Dyadobacter bucti]|uniref:GNAT family N-acetyltransferase n=1 Tax=Dyadobacter bucti TaxID=2572203 RepID=UPI003F6F4CDB
MKNKVRFESIDFSKYEITEINPDLDNLGQGFKCSRNEFATYLKGNKIKTEVKTLTSKCRIIEHEGLIAGYITLMADKLTMKNPILKKEGVNYTTFPAVKIGWLAKDKRATGAGRRLLEWAIQYVTTDLINRLGIRFITVDALFDTDTGYDISGFYANYGFRYVDEEDVIPSQGNFRSMYYDIKLVIELLNEARFQNRLT